MSDDPATPLHVKVAEALGWTCYTKFDGQETEWWKVRAPHQPSMVSNYDTDWSATGPLIEKYKIELTWDGEDWLAWAPEDMAPNKGGVAKVPLIAVCNLFLALKEAGKLLPLDLP
jgi:hypothetical protein